MPRRLLSVAAAGALLLGLAACGEPNDGPVTTPPPDIGISDPSDGGGDTEPSDGGGGGEQTESPTAGAPDIPPPDPSEYAGMDENTPEGAEQAARYFVAITVWAYQSGDLELHDSLVSNDCSSCDTTREEVTEYKQVNEFWSATDVIDRAVEHDETHAEYDVIVRYSCELTPHTAPTLDMTERIDVAPVAQHFDIGLDWSGQSWIVSEFNVESEETE